MKKWRDRSLRARLRQAAGAAVVGFVFGAVLFSPAVAAALGPGDLDPAFGAGGTSVFQFGRGSAKQSQVGAVALQPDGKIVLGGYGTDSNGNRAFLVARLDAGGRLDPSFGDRGEVLVQLAAGDLNGALSSQADALALQSDGKILAGGNATNGEAGFILTRLNADGTFDPAFGQGGRVVINQLPGSDDTTANAVGGIALDRDGKIVVAGTAETHPSGSMAHDSVLVARFNRGDGSLDSSFGAGGVVTDLPTAGGHPQAGGEALALQSDGKIVVAGFDTDGEDFDELLVVRLSGKDGALDSTFGSGGNFLYQPFGVGNGATSDGYALGLQSDGKIVVAGAASGSDDPFATNPDWRAPGLVVRLNGKDGTFDSSFGSGGKLLLDLGTGASPASGLSALALQPDGKILVGGSTTDSNSSHQLFVARLNATNGSFDSGFANNGKYLHQFGARSEAHALALQSDGKIVAVGLTGSQALITRLLGKPPSNPPGGGGTPPGGSLTPTLGGPGPATLAVISQLGLAPSAFAAANAGPSIARSTGASVSYSDSQAATTTFTVLRPARGVKRGSRCLKPGHGRRGKRCTRYVSVGSFRHFDQAGANSFHFTGRVRRHKLAPGRYRLQAIPRFAGRAGGKATTSFRITR